MEYRGRKIWLIYFAARFINGKVMKICSLLASGGKIWNLFKAAVVTSSRQVYQRMKVSQLVAYISRMRPHYRKYIFVDRPPNNIFWTFFSFDPCSNSCSNIFQIVLFLLLFLLLRPQRNVSNAILLFARVRRLFNSISHRSIFLISRRPLFAITSKERKFYSSTCWKWIRFEGWHETVSIDRSVTAELLERWYMDVYRR